MRPLGLAEAEALLRKAPLKQIDEDEAETRFEEEEDISLADDEERRRARELMRPVLPQPTTQEQYEAVEILQTMLAKFHLSDAHLLHIEKRMLEEVNRGLAKETNPKANVKSFVTYIHTLPCGREEGSFLALDLGGTNFRVILIELEAGSRSVRMSSSKHEVCKSLMLGPGPALFDFIAKCLHHFLVDHNLFADEARFPLHLGFTFSFPTRQRGLASAELVTWTKGYACAGVEGEDVTKLLTAAIARRGPYLARAIQVDAIINDTTGCLLACAYKRPDCAIGVILGTGTNASYVEEMKNVDLYEGDLPTGAKEVVINTEWGAFGNTGSLDIVRTDFDHALDKESINPGKQVYEKLISGMYLGELARRVIVEAIKRGVILKRVRDKALKLLGEKGAFLTKFVSEIESDPTRDDFENAEAVMKEIGFDEDDYDKFDLRCLRHMCECISCRASDLAGAGIASLVNKIGRRRITVGADGSVYKFHPHFGRRMRRTVSRLVCDCIQFDVVLSEDGSGRGAALAAAAGHVK